MMNLRSERPACVATQISLACATRLLKPTLMLVALAATVSGSGNALDTRSVHLQNSGTTNVWLSSASLIFRSRNVEQSSRDKVDAANAGDVKAPTFAHVSAVRACEGETAGKAPVQVALRHYIKGAEPIPRRFLSVVGTDTAVSESGMKVLAEYGPTYFYTGSDAVKAKLKDNLERIGPYPALLIVVRSNKKVNATTQSVRVGGHYISGEFDGKVATSREYTLVCAATGWVIKEAKEEPAK